MSRLLRAVPLLVLFAGAGSSASPPSLDGVWRSQGYGYVFEIRGSTLKAFEVTTTTCVPGFMAQRRSAIVPGQEAAFRTKDNDTYFVRTGGAADHKLLHQMGALSDIRIDRLPGMPAVCDQMTANTPLGNFQVFTQTWAEHYISFDLKHTDWDKVVAEYRQKITPQTTPSQLFAIFEEMIKPFGDAHTAIYARPLKRQFEGFRPGTGRVMKGGEDQFQKKGMYRLLAVTERAYLHGPLQKFCNGQIQYGHLDRVTGYLRILAFGGYTRHGDFAANLAALEKALDKIFSDPTLEKLVLDERINFGGDDPLQIAVVSRLATSSYLACTKQARADPTDRNQWTPGDPIIVQPSSRPGFRGPVIELTGPLTISAGETFTQALMGRTPHILRIGENTQGVFSDVLGRHLPNGWFFGLPNEVFRTAAGTTFDGPGIPSDIAVPVFADADVAAGRDPALAKAIQVLQAAHSSVPAHDAGKFR